MVGTSLPNCNQYCSEQSENRREGVCWWLRYMVENWCKIQHACVHMHVCMHICMCMHASRFHVGIHSEKGSKQGLLAFTCSRDAPPLPPPPIQSSYEQLTSMKVLGNTHCTNASTFFPSAPNKSEGRWKALSRDVCWLSSMLACHFTFLLLSYVLALLHEVLCEWLHSHRAEHNQVAWPPALERWRGSLGSHSHTGAAPQLPPWQGGSKFPSAMLLEVQQKCRLSVHS